MGALANQTVVLIGGGSGIGLATARQAAKQGARLVLGGRNTAKLEGAAAELGGDVRTFAVDTADRASLEAFFAQVGALDHLFVTAATYQVVPIGDADIAALTSSFDSKFWGQLWAVRAALPYLAKTGSVTLMSGAASARPIKGGAIYGACNSAIEGLGRGLAIDLAPIRVNTVSPGTIDGNLWQQRPAVVRDAAFAHYAQASLLQRPGTEDEVAQAVLFLMTNGFTTGTTLYPDGGYALR